MRCHLQCAVSHRRRVIYNIRISNFLVEANNQAATQTTAGTTAAVVAESTGGAAELLRSKFGVAAALAAVALL